VLEEVESADKNKIKAKPNIRYPFEAPGTEEWVKNVVALVQGHYSNEIEAIRSSIPDEQNLHNQAVLEKRKEILMRRTQYVASIGEILINLGHQLRLIEDTFGLINDEIRARSPEQVLLDIDDVVYQSDSLTETLQEVAPFEQMSVAPGAGRLYDVREQKT
jgi:hypothetical protein